MAVITVTQYVVPDWRGPTTVELRIYCNNGFLTSDGKTIQAGSPDGNQNYLTVACSVVGTNLTIAQFNIDSTTDGQDSHTSRYSAVFFDTSTGQKIQTFDLFGAFTVNNIWANGTVCAWSDIRMFNATLAPQPIDPSTYSKTDILRLFSQMGSLSNPMTTLGDIIIGASGGAPMRLAGNSTASPMFLKSTGTGSAATAPAYSTLTFADVTSGLGYTPINKAGDTGIGSLTVTGTISASTAPTVGAHLTNKTYVDSKVGGIASFNGSSFATQTIVNDVNVVINTVAGTGVSTIGWSGTLSPARGGLGLSSYGTGDIPYTTGATTFTSLPIGTSGKVITSTGSAPSWAALQTIAPFSGGVLPGGFGGTGSAYVTLSTGGTTARTYTIADASCKILTNNNAVLPSEGGTGLASYAIGDILVATGTTTLGKVGIGGANTVLHGGASSPSYSAVDIVADTTGTLSVARGGSGATTLTGYLKGNGTSAFTAQATPIPTTDLITSQTTNGVVYNNGTNLVNTALGASGTVLTGTGASPAFSASPTLTGLTLSGMTQNSILFAGASGAVSQNNTRLTWDNSTFILNIKGTLKVTGSSSGSSSFVAPATGADLTYTFPNAYPASSGYVLSSDTSGNLDWIANGSGGGGGITSLNGIGLSSQTFQVGTSGSDFNIVSGTPSASVHYFNLPDASATARGVVTTGTQTFAGNKTFNGSTAFGNPITTVAGTTSIAPIVLQSGTNLTSPAAGSIEWNGVNLFITQTAGPTRKTVAYTDSNITGTAFGITDNLAGAISGPYSSTSYNQTVPLNKGGTGASLTIGASGTFLRSDGAAVSFSTDGLALTNLNASNIASGTLANARLGVVDVPHGGTGISSFTVGALTYAATTSSLGSLAGNATTERLFVYQTGDGIVTPNAPAWTRVFLTDIELDATNTPGAALKYTGISGNGTTAIGATVSAPATNQGLLWDGSKWANAYIKKNAGVGLITITDINEYASANGTGTAAIRATFGTPNAQTAGDILQWDGANWTNVPWSSAGTAFNSKAHFTIPFDGASHIVGTVAVGIASAASNVAKVRCLRFRLDQPQVIHSLWARPFSAIAGQNFSLGIYSNDGNTRHVYSGLISSGSATVVGVTLGADVTLQPGFYIFAWAVSQFTVTLEGIKGTATSVGILNGSIIEDGWAVNTSTAGALPATLGLTSSAIQAAATQPLGWPIVTFQSN